MDKSINRISRLSGILISLQTGRVITASSLAQKYQVSVRTIYRDIKTLEKAGVPILMEEGKGYHLMEGYKLPPVMFSSAEANALVTAAQLMRQSKDQSLALAYEDAMTKIKAVLGYAAKDTASLLASRIAISPKAQTSTSNNLIFIQEAITNFKLLKIFYQKESGQITERLIEPFAIYHSLEQNWVLIGYCRLRNDYRMFRLDRIRDIQSTGMHFEPHSLTLEKFLIKKQQSFLTPDTPLA